MCVCVVNVFSDFAECSSHPECNLGGHVFSKWCVVHEVAFGILHGSLKIGDGARIGKIYDGARIGGKTIYIYIYIYTHTHT